MSNPLSNNISSNRWNEKLTQWETAKNALEIEINHTLDLTKNFFGNNRTESTTSSLTNTIMESPATSLWGLAGNFVLTYLIKKGQVYISPDESELAEINKKLHLLNRKYEALVNKIEDFKNESLYISKKKFLNEITQLENELINIEKELLVLKTNYVSRILNQVNQSKKEFADLDSITKKLEQKIHSPEPAYFPVVEEDILTLQKPNDLIKLESKINQLMALKEQYKNENSFYDNLQKLTGENKTLEENIKKLESHISDLQELVATIPYKAEDRPEQTIENVDLEKAVLEIEKKFHEDYVKILIGHSSTLKKILMHTKSNIIQIENKEINIFDQRIECEKTIDVEISELRELKNKIKNLLKEYPPQIIIETDSFDDFPSYRTVTKGDIVVPTIWEKTQWGRIIAPEPAKTTMESTTTAVKDWLGIGFTAHMNNLKANARKAKGHDEELRNYYKRVIYGTFLQRIIDVTTEKRQALKNEKLSEEEKKVIYEELNVINDKFKYFMIKYTEIKLPPSFYESIKESLIDSAHYYCSLGFLDYRYIDPNEFILRKRYADLGYNMMEEIKNLFNSWNLNTKEEMGRKIAEETRNFIIWANTHPEAAVQLSTDIIQVCSLFRQDEAAKNIQDMLDGKAYVCVLLNTAGMGNLGASSLTPEMLKYKALGDIIRYVPLFAGAFKGFKKGFDNEKATWTTILMSTATGMVEAWVSRKAVDFIPRNYAQEAALAFSAVRGENYMQILERKRNIELFKTAGLAAAFFVEPKSLITNIKREFTIWWRSVQQSKGWEKAGRILTQIVLPVTSVALSTALIAVSAIGGPLTFGVAIGIAAFIIPGAFGLARKSESFYAPFDTKNQVVKKIEEEEKNKKIDKIRKSINTDEFTVRIKNNAKELLKEYRRKGSIPSYQDIAVQEEFKSILENQKNVQEEIYHQFIEEMNAKVLLEKELNCTRYAKIFDEKLKNLRDLVLAKVNENIQKTNRNTDFMTINQIADRVTIELIKNLEQDWLGKRFEEQQREELINYLANYGSLEEYERQNNIPPNDETIKYKKFEESNSRLINAYTAFVETQIVPQQA